MYRRLFVKCRMVYILCFLSLILQLSITFAQKTDFYNLPDRPYRLKYFASGPHLGYELGGVVHANKIFCGYSNTYTSARERYSLSIDNSAVFNTANGNFSLINTLSFRIPLNIAKKQSFANLWSVAYSLELEYLEKNTEFHQGIGLCYDVYLFSVGGFYYFNQNRNEQIKFGVRLIIRPTYVFALINNN